MPADDRRVRVLRVIARMNMGGPAHHVSLLSAHLDPERYRSVLVTGAVGAGEAELEAATARVGFELVRLPGLTPEIRPGADLRALRDLGGVMRRVRPDIVHTHTAKAGLVGRVAARAALGRDAVVVHTYHGHVLEGYFGPTTTLAYRSLETAAGTLSDALVGVSSATVDDLVRLRVAPRRKFRVVPVGLDLVGPLELDPVPGGPVRAELGARDGDVVALFMGRLVAIKRVDVLLRAIARTPSHVRLAIVGDGEERGALEALAAELGIARRVAFLGYRSDVTYVLRAADVAVLSSANEGTPVALIEAGAAGRPLVATDVGGVRDVVAPGTGERVAPGDDRALAAAVTRLATDTRLRRATGERARAHVSARFGVARLLADTDALYRELLERRG